MGAPVRFRRRSRDLRKTPRWGAERRAGTRYGPAVPFRRRDRLCRKASQRSRRSAAANFGAPLPSDGGAKGSKPTIWHDSPPGCAARQRCRTTQGMHGERKSRCRSLRTSLSTVMAGLVPAIHALLCSQGVDARDKRGHDERWFWRNEPGRSSRAAFWRNEPEPVRRDGRI